MPLPNFFIVGSAKSGTTSLYHYLQQHRDIFLSTVRKEGRFFSDVGRGNVYWPQGYWFDTANTLDDYTPLFNAWQQQSRIGDVSPDYFAYATTTVKNILAHVGADAKIIIILRDPLSRAYSHYLQNVRREAEFLSFEKAIDIEPQRIADNWSFQWLYSHTGLYADRVAQFQSAFPNTLVLLNEDLAQHAGDTLAKVTDFLGVEAMSDYQTEQKYNVGGIPREKMAVLEGKYDHQVTQLLDKSQFSAHIPEDGPRMSADGVYPRVPLEKPTVSRVGQHTLDKLKRLFEPDVARLSTLIGRDLSHWLQH